MTSQPPAVPGNTALRSASVDSSSAGVVGGASAPGGGVARSTECVRVVIRCRPMSSQEKIDGREEVVESDFDKCVVTVYRPKTGRQRDSAKDFTFDGVFPPTVTQSTIYESTAYSIVENVMEGYNGTIFAYGQTGTGKTHTMVGPPSGSESPEDRGLTPRAFEHIFKSIEATSHVKFLVHASFLEIYNEEVRDLLSKSPKDKLDLQDRTDTGITVKGLSTYVVKDAGQIMQVLAAGQRNRSVGATLMNLESSRSHSIFTVTIETCTSEETDSGGNGGHIRVGKLNMVDLAGSERQSKTGSTGDTLKEATKINLSLSALGNVISALVDSKSTFVPYRDSKLTRLLQDSLGGNTKTVMVANIGPADYNYDETVSTLRYAHRAKSIKNKPRINEDPKDAMIRGFQDEIAKLRRELAARGGDTSGLQTTPGGPIWEGGAEDMQHIQAKIKEEQEKIRRELEEERKGIEAAKSMAEQDRARLLEELKLKEDVQEKQKEQQHALLTKLKNMEEKLLQGTEVLHLAAQQEHELEKARHELSLRLEEEERMKARVKEHLDEKLLLEEKFESQADQVAKLTTKLEKLWHKYQRATTEIQDLQIEFQSERETMLESIRELQRDLKLRRLIISHFIPKQEVENIEDVAIFDPQTDDWSLPQPELTGNSLLASLQRQRPKRPQSASGLRRPTSDYSRNQAAARTGSAAARYKYDQFLASDLDPHDPVTTYAPFDQRSGAPVGSRVANVAIAQALGNDNRASYYSYGTDGRMDREPIAPTTAQPPVGAPERVRSARRPNTASRHGRPSLTPSAGLPSSALAEPSPTSPQQQQQPASTIYPKARGLVSRQ